jgi:hypothetical protein
LLAGYADGADASRENLLLFSSSEGGHNEENKNQVLVQKSEQEIKDSDIPMPR